MFKWLAKNKEWFFAGTGGVIITLIATFTFNYYTNFTQKNKDYEYKKIEKNQTNKTLERSNHLFIKIGEHLSHFKYLINLFIVILFFIVVIVLSVIIYAILEISKTEIFLPLILVFIFIV